MHKQIWSGVAAFAAVVSFGATSAFAQQALPQNFRVTGMVGIVDSSGMPAGPPSMLTGRIETVASLELNVAAALGGQVQMGSVEAQRVLIAGAPTTINGTNTGTLCTSLVSSNGGSLAVVATTGSLMIDTNVTNQLEFTDPGAADQFGAVTFDLPIQTAVMVELSVLISALGGGDLGLTINAPIAATIEGGALDGFRLMGMLTLESIDSDDMPAADPLVDQCAARQP